MYSVRFRINYHACIIHVTAFNFTGNLGQCSPLEHIWVEKRKYCQKKLSLSPRASYAGFLHVMNLAKLNFGCLIQLNRMTTSLFHIFTVVRRRQI